MTWSRVAEQGPSARSVKDNNTTQPLVQLWRGGWTTEIAVGAAMLLCCTGASALPTVDVLAATAAKTHSASARTSYDLRLLPLCLTLHHVAPPLSSLAQTLGASLHHLPSPQSLDPSFCSSLALPHYSLAATSLQLRVDPFLAHRDVHSRLPSDAAWEQGRRRDPREDRRPILLFLLLLPRRLAARFASSLLCAPSRRFALLCNARQQRQRERRRRAEEEARRTVAAMWSLIEMRAGRFGLRCWALQVW